MKQSLEIRQGQSLVMTQQLQQSIKILQYSAVEVAEFVAGELESNPLLTADEELSDNSDNSKDGDKTENSKVDYSIEEETKAAESLDIAAEDAWGSDNNVSDNYGANNSHDYSSSPSGGGGESQGFLADTIEQSVSDKPNLKDYILEQIQLDITDIGERMIAAYMVDMLDAGGYLREGLGNISAQLGVDESDILQVLNELQKCDPAGVFARDLTERLKLQLIYRNRFDPHIEVLLDNLAMVAEGNLKKLSKKCRLSEDEITDMLAEIRTLDPDPCSKFTYDDVGTLIPDIFVRKSGEGDGDDNWVVELNPDTLPKVLVNRNYQAKLSESLLKKDDKKFINEQLSNANWLIRALDQRANTMLKVSSEILRQQRLFFERGIRFLKPMTLKEVADKVDLHESSVSRVTNNKYMATERGIFELKYFFSSSLSGASGDGQFSSKSVIAASPPQTAFSSTRVSNPPLAV